MWLLVALLAGTATVGASWAVRRVHPRASAGFSVALVSWVLPAAAGFAIVGAPIKTVTLALPPLLVAGLTEVGVGFQNEGQRQVWPRRVVWSTSVAAFLVLALGYDPFGDPSCRRTCLSLPVLWGDQISTLTVMRVAGLLVLVSTMAGLAAVVPTQSWVSGTAALALAGTGGGLAFVLIEPTRSADARQLLESATGLALLATAAAALGAMLLVWWRRRKVEDLVAQLTAGVSTATFEFCVGEPPRWVDAQGQPGGQAGDDRFVELRGPTGPVARYPILGKDRGFDQSLAGELHPATLLALDNVRLAASARAQLVELRESQSRIVASADAERWRIGRDLHDQTQQRLVGAALHLRAAAVRAGPGSTPTLEAAAGRLSPVLAALREISHGPFPDVLAEDGLPAALADWAADHGPAELSFASDVGRLSEPVARAAYAAVVGFEGGHPYVDVSQRANALVVRIVVSGGDLPDITAMTDRVGRRVGRSPKRPTTRVGQPWR